MKRLGLAVLVVLLLAVAAFPFTLQAQDDMMDTHVCDSTLLTLLLVAEGDYGFHSMQDTSTFEKGQLQPLFDTMMMGMDDMGDDMGDDMSDDMGDEAMGDDMGDDMMDDMVMLTPGVIDGEDEACTALREELEAFFYDHWAMMGEEDM